MFENNHLRCSVPRFSGERGPGSNVPGYARTNTAVPGSHLRRTRAAMQQVARYFGFWEDVETEPASKQFQGVRGWRWSRRYSSNRRRSSAACRAIHFCAGARMTACGTTETSCDVCPLVEAPRHGYRHPALEHLSDSSLRQINGLGGGAIADRSSGNVVPATRPESDRPNP